MSGVMVVLLMYMTVKYSYVFIRHEKIDCFGDIARPPVPFGEEIEKRPVRENHDAGILFQLAEVLTQPLKLGIADT